MVLCCRAQIPAGDAVKPADAEPLHVIDIFRRHGEEYREKHSLTPEQDRVLRDMQRCRTAALGGHLYVCPNCDFKKPQYHSCRNRHCPNCQALAQARWIQARTQRILSVGHHHVVFTLPSQLRPLARLHPRQVYGALFQSASDTLSTLAKDVLSAQLGVTAVLHTWTRKLLFHPHLHCIVTSGGLTADSQQWTKRTGYLFSVHRMKALFRIRLLHHLNRLRNLGNLCLPEEEGTDDHTAWDRIIDSLPPKKKWVIYIQSPFEHSTHVLKYLGRYTHRVGISNQRLVSIDDHFIRFRTHGSDTISLSPDEFIRRFLLHVLPSGFRKIRHFGLYAPANVNTRLATAQTLIGAGDMDTENTKASSPQQGSSSQETWSDLLATLTGHDPLLCPACGAARLISQPIPRAHGPPLAVWRSS
jgi:hypothetical protein